MVEQKSVLMLSYIDYPYYVGLSRRISGVSKVLKANGVNIKVVAPLARSQVVLDDGYSGHVSVKRFDFRRFGVEDRYASKMVQWLLFSVRSSFFVIKEVIKNRSIVQFQSTYSAFPAVIAKIVLRATVVGDDVVLINPFVDRVIFKLTDCISTPSKRAYSYAKQLGKTAFYVPNGAESNLTKELAYEIKQASNIIFVGALTFLQNLKAVENILQLAKSLDEAGQEFTISIVGGPLTLASELMKDPIVKKGRVNFLGQLSFEELSKLYASAAVGILPFFQDIPLAGGQRTKALEFFANNLLVISGPEGIRGINGIAPGIHYVVAMSLLDMQKAIEDYLAKSGSYMPIISAGTRYVNNNHSWEKLTKSYVNAIKGS